MNTLPGSMLRLALVSTLALGAGIGIACGAATGVGECSTNADCFEGYACDVAQTKICLRECTTENVDSDCLQGQTCDIVEGEATGVCRSPATADEE